MMACLFYSFIMYLYFQIDCAFTSVSHSFPCTKRLKSWVKLTKLISSIKNDLVGNARCIKEFRSLIKLIKKRMRKQKKKRKHKRKGKRMRQRKRKRNALGQAKISRLDDS